MTRAKSSTGSTVPTVEPVRTSRPQSGRRYRVSAWVRAERLSDGALWIASEKDKPAIEIPGGTYGWTRFEGEWELPVSSDGKRGNVVNCRLEIISSGPGQAWIDDLRVSRLSGE